MYFIKAGCLRRRPVRAFVKPSPSPWSISCHEEIAVRYDSAQRGGSVVQYIAAQDICVFVFLYEMRTESFRSGAVPGTLRGVNYRNRLQFLHQTSEQVA